MIGVIPKILLKNMDKWKYENDKMVPIGAVSTDIQRAIDEQNNSDTESFNKAYKELHFNPPFNITKADEDKRLVFGWALVSADKDGNELIDHQGDMVEPDELEEGAYEYVLNFRDAGEEHIGTLRKKARMVESCVFTPEKMKAIGIPEGTIPVGWWIGFYVDDDTTWERIKSGKYKMFSIEGKAVREPIEDSQPQPTEKTLAKSFNDILKFNPYHDRLGRFTSGTGGSAASFTWRTKDPSKQHMADMAAEREKIRTSSGGSAGNSTETKPQTNSKTTESKQKETPRTKAIHSVEDEIRHQNYESAAVIDKNGERIIYKDGANNSVGFHPYEVAKMDGNTLTHNHPSSSMFSYEDMNMLVKANLSEIRATTRDGKTYSMRQAGGTDSQKQSFLSEYRSAYKKATAYAQGELDNRRYFEKIMSGEITNAQANKDMGKIIADRMTKWAQDNATDYGFHFSVESRSVKAKKSFKQIEKRDEMDGDITLDAQTQKETDAAFKEWFERHKKESKEKTEKSFNDFLKERR